jgi:ribosomal protein S18 acetylase RimI-like enzyme
MKIREMAEGDIPELARRNAQIFGDTDENQAAKVFSNSFRNRVAGACLVAEDGGKIVGGILAEKKITFSPNAAGIKSFFVAEECRGKGVGKTLLEKCIRALESAGIETVSLTVDPENKGAISVYEKAGFGLFRLKYLKKL